MKPDLDASPGAAGRPARAACTSSASAASGWRASPGSCSRAACRCQRQRRQRTRATLDALRALGATVHVGHDAAHVADADTVVVTTAVRDGQPRARRGPPARAAGAAPLAGAGRADAPAGARSPSPARTARPPPPRCSRSPLRRCGADPSFAIGGELTEGGDSAPRGHRRRLRRRGRRVATARSCCTAPDGRGRHQRRARPPRPLRHAPRPSTPRSTRSPTGSCPAALLVACADDPGVGRAGRGRPRTGAAARRASPTARPPTPTSASSSSTPPGPARASGCGAARPPASACARCACPGAHNALNAAAALARPASRLGADPDALRRRSRRVRRRPAAVRAQGRRRPACGSSTTTRTTRPRSPPRCAPSAGVRRRRPGARGLPAAPVQPDPDLRGRVRRARSGWPTRSSCSTSTAPGRTRSPASPGAGRPLRAAAAGQGGLRAGPGCRRPAAGRACRPRGRRPDPRGG